MPGSNLRDPRQQQVRRDEFDATSPDAKRRRYNQGGYVPLPQGVPQGVPQGRQTAPVTPFPFNPHSHIHPQAHSGHGQQIVMRRESLPRPDQLLRGVVSPPARSPGPGLMGPPPRPGQSHQQRMMIQGPSTHDPTLTLPPLQTTGDQSRSVEAMVMSMPYIAKVKILNQIAPSLKSPGPTSPTPGVRGGIVAVEGDDIKAVKALEFFEKGGEHVLRVMDGPKVPTRGGEPATLDGYLSVLLKWHAHSKEIIEFITTPVTATDSPPSASASVPAVAGQRKAETDAEKAVIVEIDKETLTGTDTDTASNEDAMDTDGPTAASSASPKGTAEPAPTSTAITIITTTVNANPAPTSPARPTTPTTSLTPLILLPTYALHASNSYSSHIPITDFYSPADHWQWAATLWRGIVGPDVTVYIKDCGAEEMEREKSVEVKEELKCVLLRRLKGKEVGETAARRVGFEVGKWVRGLGKGVGVTGGA
ncbi:slightly ste11-like protein [Cryomyces antarcticus]|uniref:Slightly ste11-like protein n=1 Tax=Cryomyces antarcticus TaxID=329879 RepID=A0ABR0M621_9PEZI|nr:slightly ste11-like protein [Cryomyces antarcticus]KAK5285433.1 slightly ste11-like protein [Cryomyces antarcticus]